MVVVKLTEVPVEMDGEELLVPSKEGVSEFCRFPILGKLRTETDGSRRNSLAGRGSRGEYSGGSSSSRMDSSLDSFSKSSMSSIEDSGLASWLVDAASFDVLLLADPFAAGGSGYTHSLFPLRHPSRVSYIHTNLSIGQFSRSQIGCFSSHCNQVSRFPLGRLIRTSLP